MLMFVAGQRLTASSMVHFLEFLPQEPADPGYSKVFSGSASYEWETASLFRVCRQPFVPHTQQHILAVAMLVLLCSACCTICWEKGCFVCLNLQLRINA